MFRKLDPMLLLVVFLSLFTIGPLLQPGYFWQAHDARHSVYFVFELDRGIQDGVLYPRWQPDFAFGYGYPFFNIYGPLSTFAAEVFHLLGVGFTGSVKIVFGLAVVGSGLAMYGFIKQLMGRQAALVAAVAYMTIPYRLVDLYVRAALAESVAYLFVPLVLWGLWSTLHRPRLANVVGLAGAYAALMVTHPLTALLTTVIVGALGTVLVFARVNEEQPLRQLSRESALPLLGHVGHVATPTLGALLLGLGLCAFFAVPAMSENRFVRVDQWYGGRYAWGGDFVEPYQLFSPAWGFGTSRPGPDDGMSFQLGAVPAVLSLLAVAGLARRRRPGAEPAAGPNVPEARPVAAAGDGREPLPFEADPSGGTPLAETEGGRRRAVWLFAALAAVAVLLMLQLSAPLWSVLPLARLVQFPWRLLSVTVVAMAVLCGAAAARPWAGSGPAPSTLLLAALLVLSSLPYMRVGMSEGEVSLAGLMRFQQSSDEMTGSTAWVKEIPRWSSMADLYVDGQPVTSKVNYGYLYNQGFTVHARTIDLRTGRELIEVLAKQPALVTFDTFYYPGWRAYLLDARTEQRLEELEIEQRGELGLITVRVPAGLWRVLLRFEDTPLRKASAAVTWASLALVVALVAMRRCDGRRWRRRSGGG